MTELVKSFTFGEAIGEKVAVKFSQEGVVVKASSAADEVCGITLFAGAKGAVGDVLMLGLGKVATSAAVSAGDFLIADANGKLKPFDEDSLEGVVTVVGQALETASAAAHLNAVIRPQIVFIPAADTETQAAGGNN